jgi:hypothetical protein
MNPEIKQRWVEALRSGEYKQTREELYDGNGGYCCLGVLCDLAIKDGVLDKWDDYIDRWYPNSDELEGAGLEGLWADDELLPAKAQHWAGLTNHAPNVPFQDTKKSLSILNDEFRLDFNTIADLIEEQL